MLSGGATAPQVHTPDPEQLDREIRADYPARPVPRDLPARSLPGGQHG